MRGGRKEEGKKRERIDQRESAAVRNMGKEKSVRRF